MKQCVAEVLSVRGEGGRCNQWVLGKGTRCYAHDKATLLDLGAKRKAKK